MNRIQRLERDQSGMSLVFVGFGMMAFVGASMLAIDVGMLMTARSQAQNSADAGALAGATALVYDSFTDRSAGGPAVTSAIRGSQMNNVMGGQVSVQPGDVTFPTNPTSGAADRVQVTVRRTTSRGNPVATLIAKYFGMATSDIGATAIAEASPANAMDCVKPFTIPDKWIEKTSPPWNSLTSTYDAFNNKGQPIANPDIYIPAYNADNTTNPNYTGYRMFPATPGGPTDVGTRLTIRAGTGSQISPSFYFSLAMTSDTGGSDYRWNIANCNTTHYKWGDVLVQEPGSMMGPTTQGIEELIAKDSSARYNTSTQKVDSVYGNHSPRVFPIPLYDPIFYDSGKRNGRIANIKMANWICFFADTVSGNDIQGILVPCIGVYDKGGPAPNVFLPKTIRLIG